jgi:hypothetical protein
MRPTSSSSCSTSTRGVSGGRGRHSRPSSGRDCSSCERWRSRSAAGHDRHGGR